MEEQKIVSKEVRMSPVVNSQETSQNEESSLIEELQKWDKDKLVQQIIQMNRQLYNQSNFVERLKNQIKEMGRFISDKRMEYLFKVIELSRTEGYYKFNSDFVIACIDEIQEAMTIPEQNVESK